MLDLHILHHAASTTPEWWEQCMASANAAQEKGLCSVRIIDTDSDHIGANRAAAIAAGSSPYVAWLDSDDLLMPLGIQPMLDELEQHPEACGVYSNRQQIDATGKVLLTMMFSQWNPRQQINGQYFPHQLAIYRREAITPHLSTMATFKTYSEFVVAGLATQFGPWRHVPIIAYQRRERDYYINHARPIDRQTTARALAIVTPILQSRVR